MTHSKQHSQDVIGSQEAFDQLVQERLRYAVRIALISVLEEEVTAFIGAKPYERSAQRQDQRNGQDIRHLETTVGQIADLPVPRTRAGYQTQLFERYHRRRDELDSAIGEMFVKGVSTAKVGQVIETLTGSQPSASTVSRVFHTLEAEYEQWKQRQLNEHYASTFADGTYFTVIYNGEGCKMPILAVVGIATTGERDVLAFRVGDRENQQAWEDLFDDLKARGVKAIDLWKSRWQPGHAQCDQHQICHLPEATLRHAQNGQCAQLHPKQAAGADQTGVTIPVLSEGSASR